MANATSTQLQELYVAYFGRAADPTGLDYWTTKGTSTAAFAANMYAQPEFKNEYGSLSIESQVNQIYKNLFNRSADVTGLTYWTQEIKLGNLQLAEIAVHLIWAAQNNDGSSDDKSALTNRTNAAVAYTDKVKESTAGILAYQPTSTDPWVSGANITTAKTFLSTIDKDTAHTADSVAASVTTITSSGSQADASTAKSFTLTTNTDAGASFTGGAGDDTFSSSSSTFNSDDVLDGGAGSDTFSVTASGAGNVVANFSAIETVRVLNGGLASTDYALNMIGATGATELVSRLSTGEVSFDNVQAAAKITAYGTQTSSKTTVGFLNSLASGSADSVSLKVDGGADTTFNISGTDTANQFETINIESAGSTKNTIAGLKDKDGSTNVADVTALNITGSADLDITLAGGGTSAAVSASAATGDVKMVWGGNYTSLTGGSGADTFDVSDASFLSSSDAPKTVVGGTGTDKIMFAENVTALTSSTTGTDHSISGVETLEIEGKLANGATNDPDIARTVEADLLTDITTIQVDIENLDTSSSAGTGDDVSATINDIVDETIEIQANDGTATDTDNDISLSVNLKTDTGDADSISLKTLNPSATTTTTLDSLTVGSSDGGSTANTLPEIINLEIASTDVSSVDGTTLRLLDGQYSGTLNITGSGDASLNSVELRDPSGDTTSVINAGTYTGNLTLGMATAGSESGFKATAADTVSLTLGSGTNSVTYWTEALSADVITATAGSADTVKIKEGATDLEMTIDGVEDLEIYGAGASKVISAKNFTNVETIEIYDTADGAGDNVKLTNVAATQGIEIHSTHATNQDWNTGTVTLDSSAATATSTGATSLSVSIKGDTALNTGTISVDTSSLTLADGNVTTDGYSFDQTVALVGTTITGQTVDLNSLTLTGGGESAASTNAVLTVTGTSNVEIDTLDATGLASDLNVSGLTFGSAAAITLGDTGNDITIDIGDAARDAVDIDGGGGVDTLVFTQMVAGTYRPGLTNVEKIDVDTHAGASMTGLVTLHLGDAASVTTVELDLDAGDNGVTVAGADNVTAYVLDGSAAATSDVHTLGSSSTLTITNEAVVGATDLNLVTPDAVTLTIKQGNSTAADFHTITAAKATTMTLGGTDTDTAGSQYDGGIEATTVDAGELVTLNIDSNQGARTINTLTAAKLTTLNIVGDNTVSIGATGATTTLLATVDASTASGSVTIAGNVDLTSAANVTLGTAADTITLDILTESNVVVNAGEHATTDTGVNDTLALSGANNQGLTVIDLSSTTDQVTQINGAVNTAAATNFENIILSGLTGGQSATITGSDEANVITGTGNADTILGGKGADTITMGDGIDTVLGEAGDDIFVVTAATDILGTTHVEDTITGGDGTADQLRFDSSGGSITIADTADFGTVTGIEKVTLAPSGNATIVSLTLKADFVTDTAITNFDYSGDTNTGGSNVFDISALTSLNAISFTGSAGIDTVTADAQSVITVTASAGVDEYNLGASGTADTITYNSSAAFGDSVNVATGTTPSFTAAEDKLLFHNDFADAVGGAALAAGAIALTTVAFNDDNAKTTIALQQAANTDRTGYAVSYDETIGGAFNATFIDGIDTALAAGNAATGAGFVVADNGQDAYVLYDPDFAIAAGLGDLVTVAILDRVADAATMSGAGQITINAA